MRATLSMLAMMVLPVCVNAQLAMSERDAADLPSTATDQHGVPFAITGLSGIAYAGEVGGSKPAAHRFVAVMDNSNHLVEIEMVFDVDGSIVSAGVVAGVSLAESRDFEGIAFAGVSRSTVLLSEEGTPSVREYRRDDGSSVGALPTPPVFLSRRDNFGFESLAASGSTVWTANEEALTVDGPLSTTSAGSVVRLVRFDDGVPGVQLAYVTAPIHGLVISGSRSGLSDLVLLPDGRLLALERSLALASPLFLTRIYEVDSVGATDVSMLDGLIGQTFTPVTKRQLYSGGQTNLEGLCVGPRLADGSRVLVGVVDDADPVSVNRVVSFRLTGVVECRADWDGSGATDSADFFAFLVSFFSGAADFNADGVTDSRDFFEFLAAWFAGC